MAAKNRQILLVNRDGIVLLNELIPKNVTMFEYECTEDGRIVLTPFPPATLKDPNHKNPIEGKKRKAGRGQLIDFRAAQALREKPNRQKRESMPHAESDAAPGNNDRFAGLHHFPSRLEAEMVGEILKQGKIPFLIQSEDIGIFGPSAAPAPGGARLAVRQSDHAAAKALLSGLI